MFKTVYTITFIIFFFYRVLLSQEITQTLRGNITDADTKIPLQGAVIIISNTGNTLAAESDLNGDYAVKNVPIGRYMIKIKLIGYNEEIIPEFLISSGKEAILNAALIEKIIQTEEMEITSEIEKDKPLNPMAIISARSFSIEETQRYAGAFDDPLRAATNFAGITGNSDLAKNGIVIRGNSPKGLLWRLDGIDIPNPNHFSFGGQQSGGITVFSSMVLNNSDFFTSAFPSEYGNALSGVFDMKFRSGNKYKREYSLQAGIQGVDLFTEGPFLKGSPSTYLVNYRYSIFGFLQLIDEEMKNKVPSYQDLSFKLNFPLKNAGLFSIYGIGGINKSIVTPEENILNWTTNDDRQMVNMDNAMGAIALSHFLLINEHTFINTSVSGTLDKSYYFNGFSDTNNTITPKDEMHYKNYKLSFNTSLNHKFNRRHLHKSGFTLNKIFYDNNIKSQNSFTGIYQQIANDKGSTYLLQAFTESKFRINDNIELSAGVHLEYFLYNKKISIQPRTSLRWNFSPGQSLSVGYGNHSQLENVSVYMLKNTYSQSVNSQPNRELGFSKANHFILGYDILLSDFSRIKTEIYYQQLYNIPVIRNSYYSMLNNPGEFINDSLVNEGTGRNAGIDFTFERFLNNNYYFLFTASLWDSKYKGGDGVVRNTKYNCNYAFNFLFGREFIIGKNNLLGINIRTNIAGGEYYIPIDLQQSIQLKREILDNNRIYTERLPNIYYIDLGLTYRMNWDKMSGVFTLQAKNILNRKTVSGYSYNDFNQKIEELKSLGILPMIGFKLEF
ncbi:MAG: TonB-dependent receptor [Ignavibacteriae bacterium]|nr:MAG: TonB-dependent receptor [Ignavibacteriota bacterium]